MKNKINDKTRLALIGVGAALVVLTSVLMISVVMKKGDYTKMIVPGIIAISIAIGFGVYLKRKFSDLKKGYPHQDERSQKVMKTAGYYTFLISLYWLLALSWVSDKIPFRDIGQALNFGILGIAVIFGLCWVAVNIWGKLK